MKIQITKETVGKILKVGGMIVLYGVASMASRTSVKDVIDGIRYSGDVSYSDAVGVIMDSNMFDSNKNRAMELLKRDGDSEYYKTIVKIIKSDIFDSNKIISIATLNGEEES